MYAVMRATRVLALRAALGAGAMNEALALSVSLGAVPEAQNGGYDVEVTAWWMVLG